MQMPLIIVDGAPPRQIVAGVSYAPQWLRASDADQLIERLRALSGWRQDHIRIYGKTHPLPRLHRWFATSNRSYRWSGIEMQPEPFPDFLRPLLARLMEETSALFNTALGNLYRNGEDSVSWHSDDEPELGDRPAIASLSLGTSRRFVLRSKLDRSTRHEIRLEHGSLLLMTGSTQKDWEHCVPKSRDVKDARINLTFRYMPQRRGDNERIPTDQARS